MGLWFDDYEDESIIAIDLRKKKVIKKDKSQILDGERDREKKETKEESLRIIIQRTTIKFLSLSFQFFTT